MPGVFEPINLQSFSRIVLLTISLSVFVHSFQRQCHHPHTLWLSQPPGRVCTYALCLLLISSLIFLFCDLTFLQRTLSSTAPEIPIRPERLVFSLARSFGNLFFTLSNSHIHF
ncbi:hypothetical protein HCH54_009156 [Aspergillus fumigatus]